MDASDSWWGPFWGRFEHGNEPSNRQGLRFLAPTYVSLRRWNERGGRGVEVLVFKRSGFQISTKISDSLNSGVSWFSSAPECKL